MSDLAYLVGAVVTIEGEADSIRRAAEEVHGRPGGLLAGDGEATEGDVCDREEDLALQFHLAAYAAARDHLAARGVKDPGQGLEALLCVERARAEPS